MSYENAPATRMLATHCAVCGRPLVDATSVEAGIGPDCRKRHGYGEAQGAADWDLAERSLVHAPDVAIDRCNGTARDAANLLVHRIACDQQGPHVARMTEALGALGFRQLAERIGERLARVRVVLTDRDEIEVRGPYDAGAVEILRRVPGRRWDKGGKCNRYPYGSRRELYAALRQAYPGHLGIGPKGFFQL